MFLYNGATLQMLCDALKTSSRLFSRSCEYVKLKVFSGIPYL
jgi:hypothetical protein